jgi:hypothetical protein
MKKLLKTPKKFQEHSVIIFFENGLPYPQALYETVDELFDFFDNKKEGYFDGYCTCEDDSHGWLYMYGPDADKLFEVVKPVFERTSFLKKGIVTLQYGPPGTGARHKIINL